MTIAQWKLSLARLPWSLEKYISVESIKIEIQQVYFVKNESREYFFVKFKFIKRHDSLFLSYRDPLQNKDMSEYIYPINKRDTVDNRVGYKMCFDSVLNADHNYRKEFNDCDDSPSFANTYLKDTTITFKEYKFDCYIIEQNYNYFRNQMRLKKRVFIDKISLIPVYEDEKVFAKRKGRRVPMNKWVLTKQMKLITVD